MLHFINYGTELIETIKNKHKNLMIIDQQN